MVPLGMISHSNYSCLCAQRTGAWLVSTCGTWALREEPQSQNTWGTRLASPVAVFKGENHTRQRNDMSHQKSLLGSLTRVQHKRVTIHFPLEQPIFRSCFSHLTEAPTAGKTSLTLQKRTPFCRQNLDQALIGIASSGTFSEHSQTSRGDGKLCLH